MPGHVFITRGDLRKLCCDAWLVPTDEGLGVRWVWREAASKSLLDHLERLHRREAQLPRGWGNDGIRVIAFEDWPKEPRPYLVNVGGPPPFEYANSDSDWYMEGVHQFFEEVSRVEPRCGRVTGRQKPLVALPLVGTGHGGAGDIKGTIVDALLQTLNKEAGKHDIDVVLVTDSDPMHAAAQHARRRRLAHPSTEEKPTPWAELDERLMSEARALASDALDGRLVLFLGAGVSQGAGLPSWGALLEALAEDANISETEQQALKNLHTLDQARLIESRLGKDHLLLGQRVAKHTCASHHALAHSLIASLPTFETVTTNYDCLFEEASRAAGYDTAVLPYESVADRRRWLLKMHGCVTHPDDIVLTREHYLRYSDRRAALAGIVQALLITRRMLFVGFSLQDDHFLGIVDDVRKAVRGTDQQTAPAPFGTALFLQENRLLEELWRDDLRCVSLQVGGESDVSEAVRLLEIFLDYVLAEATQSAAHLLDPSYDGVLSDTEREIRDQLQLFEQNVSDEARTSVAWRPIAELLERLGRSHNEPERRSRWPERR